nr:MAG TPA: hypothetical protein [Caudoviricetes sp.]
MVDVDVISKMALYPQLINQLMLFTYSMASTLN